MQASASAVLGALGATARDARRPEILASKIITMLDPQQAFLVNRNKIGSMALAGESLFVLEMQPASYAILAANEAEKAARIKLVDYRMIGATGRRVPVRLRVRRPAGGRGRRRRPPGRLVNGDLDALRALVREIIRDVLPSGWPGRLPVTETVNLSSDDDLATFVQRLLDLDPEQREELRSGQKRFKLAAPKVPTDPTTTAAPIVPAVPPRPPRTAPPAPGVRRIERGAVTEAIVSRAAQAGERLVLGRSAVLTPLARDRARASGVRIEKER